MRRHWIEAAVAVTLCQVMVGCGGLLDRSERPAPGELGMEVPLEPGDFRTTAWIDPAHVVIGYEPDSDHPSNALWVFDPREPQLRQLELGVPQGCRQVRYQSPHRLPSGRLGLARVCDPLQGDNEDYSKFSVLLLAVDLQTNAATELLPMTSNPGTITWTSDETAAAAGVGTYICQGIVSVHPDGEAPFKVAVSDGATSFRLDDELERGLRDCQFTGRADFPAYSHRSNRLAFLASPASVGVEGQKRLSQPWNAYVLGDDADAHLIIRGMTDPRGLLWSLDDQWLIFSGGAVDRGQGTWAVNVESGAVTQITPRVFDFFDLSPDGSRLIGTDSSGSPLDHPRTAVIIVDLDLTSGN